MARRLDMYRAAFRGEHGFVHHLRQGWVREDRVHEVFLGQFTFARDHIALDELGHFSADHMRAEKLAGFRIEDCFDEALWLSERNRLAVADEREATDLDVVASFLRLFLRQTNACYLG